MKSNINQNPLRSYASIPSKWPTYNGEMYDTLPTERHYQDGFRDIVSPEYNTETHKLGSLIISGDSVTYQVIALTPEEIAQRQQAALDSDASAQKRQRETADGREMFEKFLVYIQREFDQGRLTGNQALSAMNMLYTPLLPLKDGMFKFAQANLNAITPPANQVLLNILNLAKQKVNDYILAHP